MKKLMSLFGLVLLAVEAMAAGTTTNVGETVLSGKSGSSVDVCYRANTGLSNRPSVCYNKSSGKWTFSNDGSAYKNLGSGSGGSGTNLLSDDNFDFEAGTSSWTASGGAFSATSTAGELLNGSFSGKFNASASGQNLDSALKTNPKFLKDLGSCTGVVTYLYAGTSGDYQVQILDQSSNVLASYDLPQSTSSSKFPFGADCSQATSVRVRFASTANAGDLIVDDVQMGDILLAQVANAELFGSAVYPTTTNCEWASPASSGWQSFPADSDCPTPTVTGKVSAPATKIPAVKIADMPPGEYMIVASGSFHDVASQEEQWALYDGTSRIGVVGTSGTISVFAQHIIGYLTNPSHRSNVTIEVQCYNVTAASSCQLEADTGEKQLQFTVLKLPSTSQTVLQPIDASALSWSGKITGCTGTNTTTSGTYADFPSQTGCTMTDFVNNNFGSVTAAAVGFGPTWTPKVIGTFEVCASFISNVSASGYGHQIVEGSTVIDELDPVGPTGGTDNKQSKMCGLYRSTAVGTPVTFKIQGKSYSGATLTLSQTVITWSIKDVTRSFPMPHLVKQLQSTSDAVMKHASAYITNSGTPAVSSQDGAWLGSPTDNGVGDISVVISGGVFSATPKCQCTGYEETADTDGVHCSIDKTTAPSSTVLRIRTRLGATLTDRDFSLSCTGPQ